MGWLEIMVTYTVRRYERTVRDFHESNPPCTFRAPLHVVSFFVLCFLSSRRSPQKNSRLCVFHQ